MQKNNNSKTPLPDHIDEAKGTKEILSLWKKHFHDIFNCIKNEGKTRAANNIVEDVNKTSHGSGTLILGRCINITPGFCLFCYSLV